MNITIFSPSVIIIYRWSTCIIIIDREKENIFEVNAFNPDSEEWSVIEFDLLSLESMNGGLLLAFLACFPRWM